MGEKLSFKQKFQKYNKSLNNFVNKPKRCIKLLWESKVKKPARRFHSDYIFPLEVKRPWTKLFKLEKIGATGMKRIDFDEIINILSGIYIENNQKKQLPYATTQEEVSRHIEEAKKNIKAAGLENHISTGGYAISSNAKDNEDNFDIGCLIEIKNLFILVKEDKNDIKPHPSFSRGITFRNNTFFCYKKTPYRDVPYLHRDIAYKATVNNKLSIGFNIMFINNKFKNIGLVLEAKSNIRTLINLTKNIFEDQYFFSDRTKIKIDDEEYITLNTNKNDISMIENKASLIIRDNNISYIELNTNSPIDFRGSNKIGKINFNNPMENENSNDKKSTFLKNHQRILWGPYQQVNNKKREIGVSPSLDPDEARVQHAETHKKFFTILKKIAIENNDKAQEIILNREILRCDHHILKAETWKDSWQDKIIMYFGWLTSNHGVSWILPFCWLIGINLFIAFPVFYLVDVECGKSFGHIFWEMFNPLSDLSESVGLDENMKNGWVSFANVIQKVLFALLVYEMIRVARRFVAK